MKNLWLCSLALAGGLLSAAACAETVYQWVDDEGVTHFTAHPPSNRQSTQVRTRTGRSEPVDYAEQFPATADESEGRGAAERPAGEPSEEELDEACRIARQNLETLERGGRIAVEDENGNTRYLNEQELTDRADRARRIRDRAC